MRLVVRNRFPLHIWTVSDYIKQTQANLLKQDTSRFITMQNIFRKLYLRHLDDHEQIKVHQQNMNNIILIGQAPAQTVADYFHKKSKVYSEDFMTATFHSIASAYHVSKLDNGGTLDNLGYKLFLTAQFCNLSEQLKYALRNNKVSFTNLLSIMKSLLRMEYVDYEIMNLLILYTQRQINGGSQNQLLRGWKGDREFQIEKQNYYNPHEMDILKTLRESNEITTALSFIRHIYQEWVHDQQIKTNLKTQNIEQLNLLIKEISTTNKNFRQIVEALLNVRREYVRMVDFSENEQILRNPSLNLELLELQEKLVGIRVLNIEDIRHVKQMSNPEYEVKRVEEIILAVLDIHKLDPLFTFIDKAELQVHNIHESLDPNPTKVFTLLNFLAKFTALDRFVYHAADGRSLITLKWEKTLIEQQPTMKIHDGPIYEQLNVSRIFRRVYGDIVNLFRSNQDKLKSIFKGSAINDKLQLLDAYCRVGLAEQTVLQIADFQKEESQLDVNSLQLGQFLNLVHLMSDVAIMINNPELKQAVFNKLQYFLGQEETNQITLPLRSTIDAINYLLQNHLRDQSFLRVYARFLVRLQLKATYFPNEDQDNEDVTEAFKILALERQEKYLLHPIYINYLHKSVSDSYKKNPYLSILREAGFKWANKSNSLHLLHPYLNLGVNNGLLNGLVFSNSDETNLDGQIRSGDLNAYILRLEKVHNVKINLFSVNSFLNMNFAAQQQKHFELKSLNLLQKRLVQIFEQKEEEYVKKLESFQSLFLSFERQFSQELISKRIRFKLTVIAQLRKHDPAIETKQQEFTNKAQLLLEILEIHKLVNSLQAKEGKENRRTQSRVSAEQMGKIIQHLKERIAAITGSLQQYLARQSQKIKTKKVQTVHLQGKRQTLELLEPNSPSDSLDATAEFINYKYYNDKTYCEYKDWEKRIDQKYNIVELDYHKVSNLSKILINKFCGSNTNITLMPICKHEQRLKRQELKFRLIKRQSPPPTAQQQTSDNNNKELDYIINLQNFKHELKTTFTPKKILDFIFSFKFINDLHKQTERKDDLLLRRSPKEYFNYLQKLSERQYLESPYIKYITDKLSKTDRIKRLLEERKAVRINQKILFQKGKINSTIYYRRIEEIEKKIIQAINQLKTKMLDNMPNTLIAGELKMVHINKDELQTFEDIIKRQFSYSRYFDEDFTAANGDYAVAINLKRGRAQNNFLKFSLIKKIAEQQTLTNQEKTLVYNWHDHIAKNLGSFSVFPQFSTLQISDLSWDDVQLLKLKSSSLNSNKDMLLVDLILELNHFLDQSVIHNYERLIKAELLHRNFHIPMSLFAKSGSSEFKQLQIETEKSIVNQQSVLSEQQLNTMEQMFKTFKTEGYKERTRYAILCGSFRDNLAKMNQHPLRNELIQEYVKHLETEFFEEYNPLLIADIKQKETDKLWREVFHQSYDSANRDQLRDTAKKLILRLEVIGKNAPPFFGNLLLNLIMHPNLDPLSRENIIAAIEVNQFDMNLDSQDILLLSQQPGAELRQSSLPKEQLRSASTMNVSKLIKDRLKSLL